ncbi:MAG: efflux RND transporter periplasmic adaptor subunit [Rikenellaceae bacterium]|nr:efflux RND transporter periplasmic adaptor subunit [Rikenellaceae bacterium]
MKKKTVWVILILLALVVAAILWISNARKQELIVNTSVVERGTVELTVMATGYVQPVEEVEVGTQVSGVIEHIYVDYNSEVKKGQLIAVLEKITLEEKVTQSQASLTSARSDLNYAQQNYDRTKQLYDAKATTLVSLQAAENQLAQAQSALINAEANLSQAETNLSYAYIYSPIDGVVLDRSVNEGQTVAASFNTPTLFTIAEDLTKMQVEADVDEADIGQVKVGQPVTFTVDAYSGEIFTGTVSEVRLQPTVTSNVVTYTVIIEAPNPELKLFPGMTASITVVTQSETGVIVPVEATNFQLTQEYADALELPEPGPRPLPLPEADYSQTGDSKTVWVDRSGILEQRFIRTGISDGIHTIVHSGLAVGEQVVLSASFGKKNKTGQAVSNPLMPSPPRGGNRSPR